MMDDQEGDKIAQDTLHKQPAEKNQTQELSELQYVAPEVQDETTRLGRSEKEEEGKMESEKKDEKGKELDKEKEKGLKTEETDDQESEDSQMSCVSLTISVQLCERIVQELEVISV